MLERALRLRAQEQEPRPECWKLAELAPEAASWGTMVRAAQEQSFARPWMTERVEILSRRGLEPAQVKRKRAAKALQLLAERWLPEQALTVEPKERAQARMQSVQLRRRKLEPREWLQELEPAWRPPESPLALGQAPRTAKPPEQPGHWLRVPARAQWKLREPLV